MISVVKRCCMQSDPVQTYPVKNKVIPGYNIGKINNEHCYKTIGNN